MRTLHRTHDRPGDPLSLYFTDMSGVPRPSAEEQARLAFRLGELRVDLRRRVTESPLAALEALRVSSARKRDGARLLRLVVAWEGAFEKLSAGPAPSEADRLRRTIADLQRRCGSILQSVALPAEHLRAIVGRMVGLSERLDGVLRDLDAARGEPAALAGLELRRRELMSVSLENARDLHARVGEIRRAMEAYEEAKRALAAGNLGLVVLIAKRYARGALPLADLIQEGNLGLMKAAERFEPSFGFRFTTYAKWWIRDAITQALAEHSGAFGLPARTLHQMSKLRTASNALSHRLQRAPRMEEIAGEAGIPVEEARRAFRSTTATLSLDGAPGSDLLRDRREGPAPESDTREQLEARVARALSALPFRDRQVIELRFGIGHERAHGRPEVARLFRLSQERIRQIEEGALRRLRSPMLGVELESFV